MTPKTDSELRQLAKRRVNQKMGFYIHPPSTCW